MALWDPFHCRVNANNQDELKQGGPGRARPPPRLAVGGNARLAELPPGFIAGLFLAVISPGCGANPRLGPRTNSALAKLHSQQSLREGPSD
ncbi:hypothetical protein EK904_014428 [Melospiza melodia maxima]|nr:hypothetical protein EK904_014428 [Melospiza melodia maxima]